MSYARFSDGDVYVFSSVGGYLECCACALNERDGDSPFPASSQFDTTAEMLAHLAAHQEAGHHVPDYCIEALREDADDNDRHIAYAKAGGVVCVGGKPYGPRPTWAQIRGEEPKQSIYVTLWRRVRGPAASAPDDRAERDA